MPKIKNLSNACKVSFSPQGPISEEALERVRALLGESNLFIFWNNWYLLPLPSCVFHSELEMESQPVCDHDVIFLLVICSGATRQFMIFSFICFFLNRDFSFMCYFINSFVCLF
jgi:hypothetical protein